MKLHLTKSLRTALLACVCAAVAFPAWGIELEGGTSSDATAGDYTTTGSGTVTLTAIYVNTSDVSLEATKDAPIVANLGSFNNSNTGSPSSYVQKTLTVGDNVTLTLTDGINITSGSLVVNKGGQVTTSNLYMCSNSSESTLTISGGTMAVTSTAEIRDAKGTITVSDGGVLSFSNVLSVNSQTNAALDMDITGVGSTVSVKGIKLHGADSSIDLTGGATLKIGTEGIYRAAGTGTHTLNLANGIYEVTGGHGWKDINVTLGSAKAGESLTIKGNGCTLNINPQATIAGDITIAAVTEGTGNVNLNNGAVFNGTIFNEGRLAVGGTLSVGNENALWQVDSYSGTGNGYGSTAYYLVSGSGTYFSVADASKTTAEGVELTQDDSGLYYEKETTYFVTTEGTTTYNATDMGDATKIVVQGEGVTLSGASASVPILVKDQGTLAVGELNTQLLTLDNGNLLINCYKSHLGLITLASSAGTPSENTIAATQSDGNRYVGLEADVTGEGNLTILGGKFEGGMDVRKTINHVGDLTFAPAEPGYELVTLTSTARIENTGAVTIDGAKVVVKDGATFAPSDKTITLSSGSLSFASASGSGYTVKIDATAGTDVGDALTNFIGAVEVAGGNFKVGEGDSYSSLTVLDGGRADITAAYAGDITLTGDGDTTYKGALCSNKEISGMVTVTEEGASIIAFEDGTKLSGGLTLDGDVTINGTATENVGGAKITIDSAVAGTGDITMKSGTLALGSNATLSDTNTISVAANATLDLSDVTTLNAEDINLAANSKLKLHDGSLAYTGSLTIEDGAILDLSNWKAADGSDLTVYNFERDTVIFTGVTNINWGEDGDYVHVLIDFGDGNLWDNWLYKNGTTVYAIPEPTTATLSLLALAALAARRRRK